MKKSRHTSLRTISCPVAAPGLTFGSCCSLGSLTKTLARRIESVLADDDAGEEEGIVYGVCVSLEAIAVVYRKSEEAIDQSINRQRSEAKERKKGSQEAAMKMPGVGPREGGGGSSWDAPQKKKLDKSE